MSRRPAPQKTAPATITPNEVRRALPLNALRAFEAAARLHSFTAAARELGVTHGAISRQVRGLERLLGIPLFVSSGRGITQTNVSARLAAEIGHALDLMASSIEYLIEPTAARIIRINATPTFMFQWLIPRIDGFRKKNLTFDIRLSARGQRVEDLSPAIDVVIRRGTMVRQGFKCVHLLDDFMTPVCAPLLLKETPVASVRDLAQHTLLISDAHPNVWQEWFTHSDGPMARKHLRFEHFQVLVQAALDGLGVALAPAVLVEEHIRKGRLVVVFDQPRLPSLPFYVLYRAEGEKKQRVGSFIKWLMAEAEAFRGEWTRKIPAAPKKRSARATKREKISQVRDD